MGSEEVGTISHNPTEVVELPVDLVPVVEEGLVVGAWVGAGVDLPGLVVGALVAWAGAGVGVALPCPGFVVGALVGASVA